MILDTIFNSVSAFRFKFGGGLLLSADIDPAKTALLVIDVQTDYCDPHNGRGNNETRAISEQISKTVPAFRKAGIPVFAIYSAAHGVAKKEDYYKFKPARHDLVITKNKDSAFEGSGIGALLRQRGITTIIACGFNLNSCVYKTLMDARGAGFRVLLLDDLTGNDNQNMRALKPKILQSMVFRGIRLRASATLLHKGP